MSVNGVNPESAGQSTSGESHETLHVPPEGLTPERVVGAGSREQGGGEVAREARPRSAVTLLGNALLDEHRRLTRPPLPRDVAQRTGDKIDALLGDPEITPDDIRGGLALLRSKPGLGPGVLPNLVHEFRQKQAHPELTQRASPRGNGSRRRGGASDDLSGEVYGQGRTRI